jgi:hypothetical protein
LGQAIVARYKRDFERAEKLYAKGLAESPTAQLVLSYAAWEKSRNRKEQAMAIYFKGIERIPANAKLREDAGVLAASVGDYATAVRLLKEALPLSKKARGGGRGVLLALAHTYYDMDDPDSLPSCVHYYEEAQRFKSTGWRLPSADLLQLKLAKIRTQHPRGNIAFKFLRAAGFKIFKAEQLEQATEGADFFVQQTAHPELIESYGLGGQLLVRCSFKSLVSAADLTSIDRSVAEWGRSDLIDDQVALLIVGDLPDDLHRVLSARLETKENDRTAAIVPIAQSDIREPVLDGLRSALDRWLFRRDLFAGNRPVVGRRFFGRDKPLAELRDAIASSSSAGIFGLRKVGKTSLAQECQRRSLETGDIALLIDLLEIPADINDCGWLYYTIAESMRAGMHNLAAHHHVVRDFKWRLAGQFLDYLDVPPNFRIASAFDSDLSRLLQVLSQLTLTPKPKLVLLLDEVERILPTAIGKAGLEGFFDFFSYLRGVSQRSGNFVLIVTGANTAIAEAAQFSGRDNPVFNFFREIYLPHLEAVECSKMIRILGTGMGIRFEKEAATLIFGLTGGHPFFARQLCSFIAGRHRERPLLVNKAMVDGIAGEYLDSRGADLDEIVQRLKRDFPDELRVCIALANAGGTLPLEDVRGVGTGTASLRHLTGYQIVRHKDNKVSMAMALLTRWIQQNYAFAP